MADFLPSRSVLSVCFPGCVLTNGEAEQQRKSKEIDKCLSREKTYVKRLVKILLLGAGESGKSTFLKQMRIIHGQDFDQRAREEFRPTIYSNVIKGAGRGGAWGPQGTRAGHRPHPPVPSLRRPNQTRSDGQSCGRASVTVLCAAVPEFLRSGTPCRPPAPPRATPVRVTVGPALRGWPRPLREGSAASRVTRGSEATCVLPELQARPPISSFRFYSSSLICPSRVGDSSNPVCHPYSSGRPRPPLDLSKFWNGRNEETFFFPETLVKGIE